MNNTPRLALAMAAVILQGAQALGQLQWDTNIGAAGAQGGTGNWVGTNFWLNGATNGAWVDGSIASFGGTSGTVTVNAPVVANELRFLTGGYTLDGLNTLTLGGAAPVVSVTNAADSATISAILGGAGGLTKNGNGTLVLSGVNTFTGVVTINAGSISVATFTDGGVAGTLGAGTSLTFNGGKLIYSGDPLATTNRAVSLQASGGTIEVASSAASLTLSGIISGAGALTKTGPGQLGLQGGNTFTGNVVINEGQITVTDLTNAGVAGQLGAGNTIVLNGGTLFPIGANDSTNRAVILGTNGGVIGVGGTTEFSGVITGGGATSLQKIGTGTLILSGDNTFAGDVFVGNSVLRVANGNAIPDTAGVDFNLALNPVLDLANSNETIGSLGALTGGTLSGGAVTLGTGTLTVGANNRNTTFTGVISGAGGSLAKMGTGTLTLTGTSTFTGNVSINGGSISVSDVADSGVASPLGAGNSIALNGGTLVFNSSAADSMNRAIVLGANGGTIQSIGASQNLTLSGVISGTGGLTKTGTGAVRLTATNTFTGPVTINAAFFDVPTLTNIGVPGPLGAGTNITINGGAIIIQGFNSHSTNRPIFIGPQGSTFSPGNGTMTLSGPITGNGTFSTTGNGIIILTGTNTFTGNVFISSSIIRLANGQAIPDTAEVFIGGGSNPPKILDLNNSSETIGSLRGGDATGGNVTLGSGTLTIGGDNTNETYGGTISGTGSVVKIGTGTQTLTGTATFTGPCSFNGGGISVADVANSNVPSPLGAGVGLLFDGGTVIFAGTANDATDRPVTLNAGGGTFNVADIGAVLVLSGVINGTGALAKSGPSQLTLTANNLFTGPLVINGGTLSVNSLANSGIASAIGAGDSISLNGGALLYSGSGNLSTNRSVTLNGGGTLGPGNGTIEYSGPISGSGALNFTGPGVLILSGTNTYDGPTTIANTTVRLANGNAIPNNSALSLEGNASAGLDLNNSSETIGSLSGGSDAGGNVTLGSGTLTTGENNGDTTFDGIISGTGGLIKTGTGKMTLTRPNTFTGPLTIRNGGISTSSIADAGVNSPLGGGSLIVLGEAGNLGSLIFTSLDDGGTNRSVTLNGNGGGFEVTEALSTLNLEGSIVGAGGLVKSGAGSLFIADSPTYTGATLVSAGRLTLNNGISSPGGAITVAANGTLQARNIVNRAVNGQGTIAPSGGLIIGNSSSTSGFAFDGTLNVGTHPVVLDDADTAQLGITTTLGAGGRLNSFKGITLGNSRSLSVDPGVSASISGTFVNNGSVSGPTAAGQLLTFNDNVSGTGSYSGNIQFAGNFSPGNNGPASILLTNFSFTSTTTLSLEIGGLAASQHDQLVFSGAGVLDGVLTITLISGFQPVRDNIFTILDGGAALTGTFDAINFPALTPGLFWTYSQVSDTAFLTVVPEPSAAVLIVISGVAMLSRRKRAGL